MTVGDGKTRFTRARRKQTIDSVGATAALFFIGEAIHRQRERALEKHDNQTVLAKGTDHAVKGHRGDIANGRTPLETETTVGGHQGLPSRIGMPAAIAQDEVGPHRTDRLARRALHPPDGETTQPDTGRVGVAGQAATLAATGLVEELKAEGEKEGEDELDKGFGVAHEGKVGRLIVEVDGDRAVVADRCGGLSHGSPSVQMVVGADETS
jgi:hypothetical protein